MDRRLLLAATTDHLRDSLIGAVLKRRIATTVCYDETQQQPTLPAETSSGLDYIAWRPASLLATRNVLAESEAFSHAIILCGPQRTDVPLHLMQTVSISRSIDAAIKSLLILVREVIGEFLRHGDGDLTILWYDGGAEVLAPFDAAVAGTVRSLCESLFVFYEREPIQIRGLHVSESEDSGVVDWIVQTIFDRGAKSDRRWSKRGGRGGILAFHR